MGKKKKDSGWVCATCYRKTDVYLTRCPDCGHSYTFKSGDFIQADVLDEDGAIIARVNIPEAEEEQTLSPNLISFNDAREDHAVFISSGVDAIDAVLGGGLAMANSYLLGAPRGLGKSTLCLQTAGSFCQQRLKVLMALGEQSTGKSKSDAKRVGVKLPKRYFAWSVGTSWEQLMTDAEAFKPDLMILDSLDSFTSEQIEGRAGCPAQKEGIAARCSEYSHDTGCASILISHVGKDGNFRGTTPVEHKVDVLLLMESMGPIIRAHCAGKNRVGDAFVERFLRMTPTGLVGTSPPLEG